MTKRAKKASGDERTLATSLFNHVWHLIEKKSGTAAENDEMIHAAHASRYHWGNVGKPVNLARGERKYHESTRSRADRNQYSTMQRGPYRYARTME